MGAGTQKKIYITPHLVVYGDLRHLTQGAVGPMRDGGDGSTKSKASGGA
jgi:hypothetical protein